ncbi:MAG: TetR/AcrR family transcriptional regulator [Myxococcota bacterium]
MSKKSHNHALRVPNLESRKAHQILEGARSSFLDLGFEGASVDEIARRAGVSKATLYNYFADKRSLFAAVVDRECQQQAERIFTVDSRAIPLSEALQGIAQDYLDFVLSPPVMGLFRISVAEATRIPRIGRAFWDSGPDVGIRRLSQFLAVRADRGELDIHDVDLAAHQFLELCRASVFHRVLFGILDRPSDREKRRVVDGAVHTFLAAYATRPS